MSKIDLIGARLWRCKNAANALGVKADESSEGAIALHQAGASRPRLNRMRPKVRGSEKTRA